MCQHLDDAYGVKHYAYRVTCAKPQRHDDALEPPTPQEATEAREAREASEERGS